MQPTKQLTRAGMRLGAMLALAVLSTVAVETARAVELIPSLGFTKSTDENAEDGNALVGLALRYPVMSFLKLEGAIAYRQDSFSDGDLKVRQWPVTASAWLNVLPSVYAGAGIGWYRTTLDYSDDLPYEDDTSMQTGLHVGGGLSLPMGPKYGLDLNGRYIFMQGNNDNVQLPTTFNPDFWSLSLGLVFKL